MSLSKESGVKKVVLLENKSCILTLDEKFWCFSDGKNSELSIPADEYFAVAADFQERLPVKWHYGKIDHWEKVGNGVVFYGKIEIPEGVIQCRDCCEIKNSLLHICRRWHYSGKCVKKITLTYRFRQMRSSSDILLPGVLYYGNPSGKNTPGVPYLNGTPGEMAFFEEHRIPMPFISAEKDGTAGAIHFVPSPVPQAERTDTWWSCGVRYEKDFTELAGYSGFVSCNGQHGAIKNGQKVLIQLPGDGMTLSDGLIVEKCFALQCSSGCSEGSGFIPAVEAALKLHPLKKLPIDAGELIRKKYRYALSRDYQKGKIAGSLFNSSENGSPSIVFGWCGRSETLGFAAPWIGEKCGDSQAWERAEKYLDFLVSSPIDERGFCLEYYIDEDVFQEHNFVSQGQTMETFAMALTAFRNAGKTVKKSYLEFLEKVCSFFHNRVMSENWRPVSTNEAFFVSPLAMAAKLLNKAEFKVSALKIADHYIERHLSMKEPYWGGTLDASCEDKEGAVAAMTAFFEAWNLSGEQRYLDAVYHASAVFLTYLQLWDIPMPPGRLADNVFRSAGWTTVSVQNMHLDVYGVWVAPLLYKIAAALNKTDWQAIALPMVINCGQMTDIFGGQGEQFEQTNFSQRPVKLAEEPLRGGYSERWVVFWITAAFLNTAAQFELMGLSLFSEDQFADG